MSVDPYSETSLRGHFDAILGGTFGIEEEVMLLDPETLELVPRASAVLERLNGDPRFKLELPASQLEITLGPYTRLDGLAQALLAARRDLARAGQGLARPAAAGVHPFSSGVGELNPAARYAHTLTEYGHIATRQLVCALQVHIAIGGAERTLAVYNRLRSYLPLLAALAANAPFYEGCDSGLASVRPKLCELLPRQGVPPAIATWGDYAEQLRWGREAGVFTEPRTWWWELRPHTLFGTLELRVPDAQTTVEDAAALTAVAVALGQWLAERYDGGERATAAPTWRIEENRWSACRHGTSGTMADLQSGRPRATREILHELIATLRPRAEALGAAEALEHAARLIDTGGADRQRAAAREAGIRNSTRVLVERFLLAPSG